MSKKIRIPKVAITRGMIESGLTVLDAMTADNADVERSDEELVANVFFCMWETYWKEIEEVRQKKMKRPIVVLNTPGLILPKVMRSN